jgi:hypothetical protein
MVYKHLHSLTIIMGTGGGVGGGMGGMETFMCL